MATVGYRVIGNGNIVLSLDGTSCFAGLNNAAKPRPVDPNVLVWPNGKLDVTKEIKIEGAECKWGTIDSVQVTDPDIHMNCPLWAEFLLECFPESFNPDFTVKLDAPGDKVFTVLGLVRAPKEFSNYQSCEQFMKEFLDVVKKKYRPHYKAYLAVLGMNYYRTHPEESALYFHVGRDGNTNHDCIPKFTMTLEDLKALRKKRLVSNVPHYTSCYMFPYHNIYYWRQNAKELRVSGKVPQYHCEYRDQAAEGTVFHEVKDKKMSVKKYVKLFDNLTS